MKRTSLLLSLAAGLAVCAPVGAAMAGAAEAPASFQEKKADEKKEEKKSETKKKKDEAEEITVWILDATGSG